MLVAIWPQQFCSFAPAAYIFNLTNISFDDFVKACVPIVSAAVIQASKHIVQSLRLCNLPSGSNSAFRTFGGLSATIFHSWCDTGTLCTNSIAFTVSILVTLKRCIRIKRERLGSIRSFVAACHQQDSKR